MQSKKQTRFFLFYFLLVAFDVGTVLMSLAITRQIVNIYTSSVKTNQDWSARLSNYLELGQLSAAVNAPGNDVFDSLNPDAESARLRAAQSVFNDHMARLENDAKTLQITPDGGGAADLKTELGQMPQQLTEVKRAMMEMTSEAELIFGYFRQNQPKLAGQRMATMDRKYAAVNDSLGSLRVTITGIQNKLFAGEIKQAASIQKLEIFIALLVLLMVSAASFYGVQLKRRMAREAEERETYLQNLTGTQEELTSTNLKLETSNQEMSVAIQALKESEAKFQRMIEALEDGYYEVDLRGNATFFNRRMCKILGYSSADLQGLGFEKYVDASCVESVRQAFVEVLKTGQPRQNYGYQINRPDGVSRYVDASIALITDATGKSIGYRGIIRDVTENKQSEDAIRQSEEFLNHLINSIPHPLLVKDEQHRWVMMNDAFCAFSGLTRDVSLGKSDYELMPIEQAEEFCQHDDLVFSSGQPDINEESNTDSSGCVRTVIASKVPFTDPFGRKMLACTVQDITARKQAELELQTSQLFLQNVLNAISDPVLVKDEDRRIVLTNDAFCQLKGKRVDELVGQLVDQFSQSVEAEKFKQQDLEVFHSGVPSEFVEYNTKASGERYCVATRKSVFTDPSGKKLLLSIARDITKIKEAEEAALLSQKRLNAILQSLDDVVLELDGQGTYLNIWSQSGNSRPPEEMIGKRVSDFYSKEQAEKELAIYQRVLATGQAETMEYRDNQGRWMLARFSPVPDLDGTYQSVCEMDRDISDRKEAEEETLRNENRLRTLISSLDDIVIEMDGEGTYLNVWTNNPEMLGIPTEDLIGRKVGDLFSQTFAQFTRGFINQVLSSGKTESIEYAGKDGRWIMTRATPIPDEDGKYRRVLLLQRDISSLKQSELEVRQSEARLTTILSSLDEVAVEMGDDGTYINIWTNDESLLARPREEMLGKKFNDYYKPEIVNPFIDIIRRVLETNKAENIEFRHSSGRWLMARVAAIPAVEGRKPSVCILQRDITERRETENKLQNDLTAFLAVASMVSEGDLTQRARDGEDALGKAVQGVNRMLDNFSLMLSEVRQVGLSVSSSATQILAASEQIAAGAQRQADEITNTSSAVEEMAASMSQVSKNAEASAESARRASQFANKGDLSTRQTMEAMSRIESAVQRTGEKMRVLSARSSEISEIISLINEIAAQTNLLALNAAIEAAHAGQAGLGFSVVADEIRKLAERTSRATKDVGNLIKAVQSEIAEAVTAMENGVREVHGGTKVVEDAGHAINEISDAVRQSVELMEEIWAASDEQARITTNLAEAMQTISGITLETSAGAHETAQTLQGMVNLSEQLNRAITQFKVKDEFAGTAAAS